MRKPSGQPTITDVAALAQVSIGTVSKALNGRGQLRAQTRERVLAAAEQLGFEPNAHARSLLSGRSFTVGLITTDSFGRFTIPIMLGAEDALGAGQISVFLCDGRGDRIRERHYIRTLLARRVDGIIVTGRRVDPRPPIDGSPSVPVVYAMAESTDENDCSLVPDDEQGGRIAVEHLLASGRSRIAHITGPERFLAARLRAQGAQQALEDAGHELSGSRVLYGGWSEEWGRQAAHILLRSAPDVDAIFCGSDQIARGVADTLREAGCRVPAQIALVGFDNWEVMAATSRPPLTTVDMNLMQLGRSAADRLLAAIEGKPSHGLHKQDCLLVVRESSGPASSTGNGATVGSAGGTAAGTAGGTGRAASSTGRRAATSRKAARRPISAER